MNDLFKLYEQKLDKPKGTALPSLLHLLGMKFRYPLITSSAAFATFSGVKPSEAASLRHMTAETAAPSSLIEK